MGVRAALSKLSTATVTGLKRISRSRMFSKWTLGDPSYLFGVVLWVAGAVFNGTQFEINKAITGITCKFYIQDIMLQLATVPIMHKGLKDNIVTLIVPYVASSCYGIYVHHYKSLANMFSIMRWTRRSRSFFSHSTFYILSFALIIRIGVLLKIMHIMAKIWYHKTLNEQLARGKAQLARGKAQPAGGKAQPARGKAQPARGKAQPARGKAQSAGDKAQPAGGKAQPAGGKVQQARGKAQPAGGKAQPVGGKAQPAGGKAQPVGGKAQPAGGKAQLTGGKAQLEVPEQQQHGKKVK